MSEEKPRAKEIEYFGVRLTIFDNGDVYVWTDGDVTVLKARAIFDSSGLVIWD